LLDISHLKLGDCLLVLLVCWIWAVAVQAQSELRGLEEAQPQICSAWLAMLGAFA